MRPTVVLASKLGASSPRSRPPGMAAAERSGDVGAGGSGGAGLRGAGRRRGGRGQRRSLGGAAVEARGRGGDGAGAGRGRGRGRRGRERASAAGGSEGGPQTCPGLEGTSVRLS